MWVGYRSEYGEKGYYFDVDGVGGTGMFDQTATFAEDRAGELYLCTFQGRILRIEGEGGPPPPGDGLPERLSELGLFADLQRLRPIEQALRYSVASQLWSDGARKQRFLVLPPGEAMAYDPDTESVYLFGGAEAVLVLDGVTPVVNRLWRLEGSDWTELRR